MSRGWAWIILGAGGIAVLFAVLAAVGRGTG